MTIKNILLYTMILLQAAACSQTERPDITASPGRLMDSLPGSSPYLTKDNKGNMLISWVRSITDSTAIFCYSRSTDGGNSFGPVISIPSSTNIKPHAENLPKIIFKKSGEIIALWGVGNPNPNNKYSGLVYYSQSFDEGKTWQAAKPLVSDTAGYDQRYYDVSLLPSGEAAIIWLDNRSQGGRDGSALYYAVTDGNDGFQNERMIVDGCCQCCRTDLFVDAQSNIHVLYRGILTGSIRDMLHSVSMDGGKTFSAPQLISKDNWVLKGCPHTGPSMTGNKEGIYFAWFTGGAKKGCFFTKSTDNGKSFAEGERLSSFGSHPQIASMEEGRMMIAWDEPTGEGNSMGRCIKIQPRSAAGKPGNTIAVSPVDKMASYPVLANSGGKKALLAYTVKENDKDFIYYQSLGW